MPVRLVTAPILCTHGRHERRAAVGPAPCAAALTLALLVLGCGPVSPSSDRGDAVRAGGDADDAQPADLGAVDASTVDTAAADTGPADTAGFDVAVNDSGVNDSGVNDSGVNDSGVNDSGVNDSGVSDSGVNDAAVSDTAGDIAPADADAVAGDVTSAGIIGPPPATLTHSFLDAASVALLLNLHQLAATTAVLIAGRLFKLGDAKCPGALTSTAQLISADLAQPCTLTNGATKLTLAGRLAFSQPNVCKGSSLKTTTITAEGFELTGQSDGVAVSIQLDVAYQSSPSLTLWTGHTHYAAVPLSWIPSTTAILNGADFKGWAVTTSGIAASGRTFSGTYWLAGAGTATLTTEKPLLTGATAQGCYKPTSGRLRFVGAVDAVVTFDGKGVCADPTWTRAGKFMGTLALPFWSTFTLCGSI